MTEPATSTAVSADAPSSASASTTPAGAISPELQQQQPPKHKIDPITAVQDSIDSLALSLFEALRGVRDAVAPESLEVPGASSTRPTSPNATTNIATLTAFKEEPDELEKDASVTDRLLNELNREYFPPRAFDLLEPDYEAFLLTYLGDNEYAKELVARFVELNEKKKDGASASDGKAEKKVEGIKSAPAAVTSSDVKKEEKEGEKPKLGEVGYEFRKKFDSGWYTGKVVEIKAVSENGYDRRCIYSDGDAEDLRLEDLEELAKLDPQNNNTKKPRLSIKIKAPPTPKSDATTTPPKGISSTSSAKINFPLSQAEYTKLLLDSEHQRDVQTTQTLAADILAKSSAVNDLVAKLPGMNRTRQMQMERINELIQSNHDVTRELEEAYVVAKKRREEVRIALSESTCLALGVEEDS